MKFRTFLMTTSLLLGGLAWAGPNDAHHKPMHGGVVNTVKDIDYELVAQSSLIQLQLVKVHGFLSAVTVIANPTRFSF